MLTTQHPMKRAGVGGWGGDSAYVIHNLEVLGNTLLKWFNDYSMKTNPGKYHLL